MVFRALDGFVAALAGDIDVDVFLVLEAEPLTFCLIVGKAPWRRAVSAVCPDSFRGLLIEPIDFFDGLYTSSFLVSRRLRLGETLSAALFFFLISFLVGI